ncbi:MAG: aspartate--tRNA ligase [SAR116 cluster bacterium]|nr:aspartate--tRNA ligase [SAR116 cluster bacterium]RPH11499.1 MAG: aspartate--tRNA ligase [Alphaproteobacteria bacterium TMED54]
MNKTHTYRTHNCNEINKSLVGKQVKLSGWVHRKRDHGQLIFVDLRDHFGISQIVSDSQSNIFETLNKISLESVISVYGQVVERSQETINANIPTGEVELEVNNISVLSKSANLPLQVNSEEDYGEEIRLKYRYLDLRRTRPHNNIILRSKIIQEIRSSMLEQGFMEFQTPILTASSPEGARDFLVPSRINKGKFYALPQAPQQFKQLIMVSGFDKYFQIAPCFRDEDSRADRSPGEFYQLDVEMSFVEQEDVFDAVQPVIYNVFKKFTKKEVVKDFVKITFKDAMLKYGTDKPDLRYDLLIQDLTDVFKGSNFKIFANNIEKGSIVRGIPGIDCGSRAFADKMNGWAQSQGAPGMGYIIFSDNEAKGPIANALGFEKANVLKKRFNLNDGDALFFSCSTEKEAADLAGKARIKIANEKNIINENQFKFCWIVDYPMFEKNYISGGIEFSHNPFSMPQGGLKSLNEKNPLDILAYQYDLVCNGIELSSGAIRNHVPEIMYKAFEIAGYSQDVVDNKFPGMINAFRFGAPPHGGIAPGIDRIVMLLADEPNLREIVLFPMTGKAEDLMMGAPSNVSENQLKELGINIKKNIKS